MTPDWDRIEAFIGYGRLDAPVVFIGMEEGLADVNALASDLTLRSTFVPVMDLEQAHRGIVDGESLFSDSPRRQPTWRVMADVMLHFEGRMFANADGRSDARRAYRAKRLGRSDGDSLLTELLPYPHPKRSDWLYADRFASRENYVEKIWPLRRSLLTEVLGAATRRAIVGYGKGDWENFKMLFPGLKWTERDRFALADWNGTPVTLTDHFSGRSFNTDQQLDALAAVALR